MKCLQIIGISAVAVLLLHSVIGNVGARFFDSIGLSIEITDSVNN